MYKRQAKGLAAELLAVGDFGYESGRAAAERLLASADPPTAIIASSEQMAIATLDAIRARGLEVPGDVSLVSFDDTPIMRFTHPPLTAVVQPIAEVTARAVELLIAAQGGGEREGAPVVVPARLTVRESTAAPRR